MMTFWLLVVVLLVVSALLLVVPVLRAPGESHQTTRDRLNTALYKQRVQEVAQDEELGVVSEQREMVQDLQQTLLADVPVANSATTQPISRWALVPGVIVLLVVSVGFYLKTGGQSQMAEWSQVIKQMPQLRERVQHEDQKPLTTEELARLGLGLRTELQQQPNNLPDWVMLGRIGMALNNLTTASQAFEKAYQLAPDNVEVILGYAEVLIQSSDSADNRKAEGLLKRVLRQDHQNMQALALLAFSAFEQENYQQAIGAWEVMLKMMPKDDSRRTLLERSIEAAKARAGITAPALKVRVDVPPTLRSSLPASARLVVLVTDGQSPVPVAVRQIPLGELPQTVTVSDADSMMPERKLSSLSSLQVKVKVIDGQADIMSPGVLSGKSAVQPYQANQPVAVEVNHRPDPQSAPMMPMPPAQ